MDDSAAGVRLVDFLAIELADPEYEQAFRTYAHYLEDLAGLIAGSHGYEESLVDGVHMAVLAGSKIAGIQRRKLDPSAERAFEESMRRAWSVLRRTLREVADDDFEPEANGWLPEQSYYAVYHAGRTLAIASGQGPPRDHAGVLRVLGAYAARGTLPFPWSATCSGCPQTKSHRFSGITEAGKVHALSLPSPDTAESRLAMFLRTTRAKELERQFAEMRSHGASGGRRNLSRAEKDRKAQKLHPTTVFDLLWRMRKKAHYEAPDAFVLGAAGEVEARHFAECLVLVTDATVAAIEALISAYVGPQRLARASELYARKTRCPNIRRRAESWERRLASRPAALRTVVA